jgi:hypothetical protein
VKPRFNPHPGAQADFFARMEPRIDRVYVAPSVPLPERIPSFPTALVDVPRAANADPETSHEAAEYIADSGALKAQQDLVIGYVHQFPGRTSAELALEHAKATCGTWKEHRHMFGRRLPEVAVDVLHVKRGPKRKCAVTGRNAITWWPA